LSPRPAAKSISVMLGARDIIRSGGSAKERVKK